jgi:PGF-CTERM protein
MHPRVRSVLVVAVVAVVATAPAAGIAPSSASASVATSADAVDGPTLDDSSGAWDDGPSDWLSFAFDDEDDEDEEEEEEEDEDERDDEEEQEDEDDRDDRDDERDREDGDDERAEADEAAEEQEEDEDEWDLDWDDDEREDDEGEDENWWGWWSDDDREDDRERGERGNSDRGAERGNGNPGNGDRGAERGNGNPGNGDRGNEGRGSDDRGNDNRSDGSDGDAKTDNERGAEDSDGEAASNGGQESDVDQTDADETADDTNDDPADADQTDTDETADDTNDDPADVDQTDTDETADDRSVRVDAQEDDGSQEDDDGQGNATRAGAAGGGPDVGRANVTVLRTPEVVGQPLVVEATTTNVGTEAGRKVVQFEVEHEVVDRRTFVLQPKETRTVTFEYVFETPGNKTFEVDSGVNRFVTVGERRPNLSVSTVEVAPGTVAAGEDVTITAVVSNVGHANGSLPVALELFGEVVAVENVTLAAGETREVSFTRRVQAPGTYEAVVDNASAEFQVTGDAGNGATAPANESVLESAAETPGFGPVVALAGVVAAVALALGRRE